jgi:hypothetical protein
MHIGETYTFDTTLTRAAATAAEQARSFLAGTGFSLGVAMVEHAWHNAPAASVMSKLAAFQNDDGGFGRGLEVDIVSPASNPFASRLAMRIMLNLKDRPHTGMQKRLAAWLAESQAPDGDWHFSEATMAGELAPWFAAWEFPSLNPACCVAGFANRLGLTTPQMLAGVASLFAARSSLEEIQTREFYRLLPYVEYASGVDWAERDMWLDALASVIRDTAAADGYQDPNHFWEHALGGGPDLVRRLPHDLLERQAHWLVKAQAADGGWPTPYNDQWRPLLTAEACVTLSQLRDGI